jgi:hypothetical protein
MLISRTGPVPFTVMRINTIAKKFAGEWVLIEDTKHSKRTGQIISGTVIAHDVDKEVVYEAGITAEPEHSAVLCFKEMEPGLILVL